MGRHVAALDGLRGVAVAAVVAYHVRPSWVPGGYLGVDLFFVLSGYLITSILLEERSRTGRVDLLAFAGRRLRRLLPALSLVVVAVVVHEWRWGDLAQVEQARRHALATLGYVANWVFIADGDSYFADVTGPSMFRHVWSLAIEEQFYLLWPLTLVVVARAGGRRGVMTVGAVAVALAAGSAMLMGVLHETDDPSRAYFGTDTRLFEPLIGAVGAAVAPLGVRPHRWIVSLAPAAGVGWVVTTLVVDDEWIGFYQGGAVVLAGVALVWIWGAVTGGRMARLLSFRPLVALGVISYGVYLWHWPILLMLRRGAGSGVAVDVAVVALSVLAAAASYVLVERPVRRGAAMGRILGRGWRPVGAGAVVIVVIATFALVATRTSAPADAVAVDEVIDALSGASGERPETAAPTPASAEPLTVVLVGDSSAWTLGGGLVGWGTGHGPYVSPFDESEVALLNLGRKGYRLIPGHTTDLGGARARSADDLADEAWWRETVAAVQPDLVVAMVGLHDLQSREIDGTRVEFASAEFDALALAAGAELFGDLAVIAPVVLLTAPPMVGADMPQPEMAAFFDEMSAPRAGHLNELLRVVASGSDRIGLIEFAEWLCPAGGADVALRNGCRTTPDGGPARHDGVHYTDAGAAMAANWLTPRLIEAAGSFLAS